MTEPRDEVGLCRRCRHARTVVTTRSTFWLCRRSVDDPSFPRYPRLPVLACRGYETAPDPVEGSGAVDA